MTLIKKITILIKKIIMIQYKFKSVHFFTYLFQMASSTIQNVSSCPDYINQFINHNFEKLNEIYGQGYSEHQEGCLGLFCNQETNKMDVMFLNRDNITQMLTSDSWENIKLSIPEGKKLYFVKDEGLNSVFLLYI